MVSAFFLWGSKGMVFIILNSIINVKMTGLNVGLD